MSAWRIDADDLPAIAPAWDDAVDRTPGVDAFCASTPWSFSAATSFPAAQPPVVVGDGHAFCGLRTTTTELGPALVGLDPVWGFATPLVGTPMRAAEMLFHRLSLDDWALAVIAGQREDSELTAALARVADGRWTLFRGTEEHRLRADLRGGFDRWFARRSSRFRQQARRIERVAGERGVEILDLSAGAPDHVFDRLLAIETHAWKGRAGTGLASEELADFYRQVCGRLAATDHLRVLVARLDGDDVGFILGGVRGDLYRGLQLSYHREHADLGLGHLLQLEQIRRLGSEAIHTYDLGMDMDYKRRWADRSDVTLSVILRP